GGDELVGRVDRDDHEAVVEPGVQPVQLVPGRAGGNLSHGPLLLARPGTGDDERCGATRRIGPGDRHDTTVGTDSDPLRGKGARGGRGRGRRVLALRRRWVRVPSVGQDDDGGDRDREYRCRSGDGGSHRGPAAAARRWWLRGLLPGGRRRGA